MAEFYLVGNLDGEDDLWLVNTRERTTCPVPREVWEDVVAMFHNDADLETRRDAAAEMIARVEADRAAGRPVNIALSANELGAVLVTLRFSPVEKAMEESAPLARMLGSHVAMDRLAA